MGFDSAKGFNLNEIITLNDIICFTLTSFVYLGQRVKSYMRFPAVRWWALDHLLMILSCALIQKKSSHE